MVKLKSSVVLQMMKSLVYIVYNHETVCLTVSESINYSIGIRFVRER